MAYPKTTLDGLMAKLVPQGDCLLWPGPKVGRGVLYGLTKVEGKQYRVHRWVFEQLNGPIPEGIQVLHKCAQGLCANPKHLYAGTPKQNMLDREMHGHTARGEKSGMAVLTEDRVKEIRSRYAQGGVRQVDLAKEFGVIQITISRVVRGETWAHVNG